MIKGNNEIPKEIFNIASSILKFIEKTEKEYASNENREVKNENTR